jgi:hypothetical protein
MIVVPARGFGQIPAAEDGSGVPEKVSRLLRHRHASDTNEAFALRPENHIRSPWNHATFCWIRSRRTACIKQIPRRSRRFVVNGSSKGHRVVPQRSDEVSGAPRILADLRADGEVISRKTVARKRPIHLQP